MYHIMLILHEKYNKELVTVFLHNHPDYTIKFVKSKEIPTNCSKIERNALWICDRDVHIRKLADWYHIQKKYEDNRPIPVIAYSHQENREESLMGAPWMILSPKALTPGLIREVIHRSLGLPLPILTTGRCLLKELSMADLPALLMLQQENIKNPGGCFFPENCAAPDDYLRDYIRHQYSFYGFGIFGIFQNSGNRTTEDTCSPPSGQVFLGIAGFSLTDLPGADAQISYALLREHQGQGYALEILRPLLAEAAGKWGLTHITARIRPDNLPSLRLIEKLGIRPVTGE